MAGLKSLLQENDTVALDTNCFIYYFESDYMAEKLIPLFEAIEDGFVNGLTSVLTITEILVKPMTLGLDEVCDEYVALLSTYPNFNIIPFNLDIAIRTAAVRAGYKIKTPDAIQVASAIEEGASLFITNDLKLPETIGKMKVVLLSEI